jgi:hypothetical protein
MGFGHERRTALLAVDDEADFVGVGVQAVQYGKIALARHTERHG